MTWSGKNRRGERAVDYEGPDRRSIPEHVEKIEKSLTPWFRLAAICGVIISSLAAWGFVVNPYMTVAQAEEDHKKIHVRIDEIEKEREKDRAEVKTLVGKISGIEANQARTLILQLRAEKRALLSALDNARGPDREILRRQIDRISDELVTMGAQ